MNHEAIYQKFIGSGKIQALNILQSGDGKWILRYKEGRKVHELECEDRAFLDKVLVEFGGKNPETCRAQDDFLKLGTWRSESINELGHRITKVQLNGNRTIRSATYPIDLPEDCGSPAMMGSKRKKAIQHLDLKLMDREHVERTLAFKDGSQFDNLCDFLMGHKTLNRLTWHVMMLGTESRDTGDQCVWKRLKAGDGTKRMVLELIGLNSVHYTECVRQELFNAAGDMFYSPCQRIAVKKKKEQTMEICMFAAEDGKVNLDEFEAQ